MDYSMWYLNKSITNVSLLPQATLDRLIFASLLEMDLKATFTVAKGLSTIYVLFMDDGLQFVYPASKRGRYSNFSSQSFCPFSKTTDNYDLRCSKQIQFGLNFLKNVPLNTTQFISKPFILMEYVSVGKFNQTILTTIGETYTQNSDIISFQNQIIKLVYNKKDGEYIGTLSPIFFPITASFNMYHGANLIFVEQSDVVMQVNF